MKIRINDRYFLQSDNHQWVLFRVPNQKDPNKPASPPQPVAWYKELDYGLFQLWMKMMRDNEDEFDIRSAEAVERILHQFSQTKLALMSTLARVAKEVRRHHDSK